MLGRGAAPAKKAQNLTSVRRALSFGTLKSITRELEETPELQSAVNQKKIEIAERLMRGVQTRMVRLYATRDTTGFMEELSGFQVIAQHCDSELNGVAAAPQDLLDFIKRVDQNHITFDQYQGRLRYPSVCNQTLGEVLATYFSAGLPKECTDLPEPYQRLLLVELEAAQNKAAYIKKIEDELNAFVDSANKCQLDEDRLDCLDQAHSLMDDFQSDFDADVLYQGMNDLFNPAINKVFEALIEANPALSVPARGLLDAIRPPAVNVPLVSVVQRFTFHAAANAHMRVMCDASTQTPSDAPGAPGGMPFP